jgi:hypothetical protein
MQLDPCKACSRHIRRGDQRCPFCGAACAPTATVSRMPRFGRLSRAQWLVCGSLGLVACTQQAESGGTSSGAPAEAGVDASGSEAGTGTDAATTTTNETGDTGATVDAAETADSGARVDAEADGAETCSRSGSFACGSETCDRASALCWTTGGGSSCSPISGLTSPDGGSCGPCPTCDCALASYGGACQCTDDGQGGLAISCQGCYGAPPVRLERLVA